MTGANAEPCVLPATGHAPPNERRELVPTVLSQLLERPAG